MIETVNTMVNDFIWGVPAMIYWLGLVWSKVCRIFILFKSSKAIYGSVFAGSYCGSYAGFGTDLEHF